MNAIRDYRRSQWQKKVADAMEQFEVAGISQTHDEMVSKIEQTTAVNEARMEMALGNVDQQRFKIEEEAEKLRANELVKQFKAEMGLLSPEASAPAPDKTIGSGTRRRRVIHGGSYGSANRKGGWIFIFILGLVLVGYGLDKYGVIDLSGWFGKGSGRSASTTAVDTSKPLPPVGDHESNEVRVRVNIWVGCVGGLVANGGLDTAPVPSTTRRA